jgi:asparagine synthase (glutamine-hydrolysing)
MCGIAGIFNYSLSLSKSEATNIAINMANKLEHRGPNDFGIWSSTDNLITFAHQRLSIQDLSKNGHQPMYSKKNNLTIIFNGEIYNHFELRKLFSSSYSWNGSSDTETLIALFEKFGVEKTVKKIDGMFAIALWDQKKHELYLIRDRFGEKPLYYGIVNRSLIWGSELKSLKEFPFWKNEMDPSVLQNYIHRSFVSGNDSIFKQIKKIPPGSFSKFKIKNSIILEKKIQFWSIENQIQQSKSKPFQGSLKDAANEVKLNMKRIIKNQLISDVPVGIFLSGGVDSRLITSLAKNQLNTNVKTFSVGFNNKEYDESLEAKKVSDYIGTDHSSIDFKPLDALNLVSEIPRIYDEPFADATQMPSIILSRLAKKSVSVVLSGEGGDELFGGYNRYISGPKIFRILNLLPMNLNIALSRLIRIIPPSKIDALVKYLGGIPRDKSEIKQLSRKLYKLSNLLNSNSESDLYNNMRFLWNHNSPFNFYNKDINKNDLLEMPKSLFFENMMASDSKQYLPDDLCVKIDRASMASGLEVRLPFLDHNLFSLAWSLPNKYKINNGIGKVVLRSILSESLPGLSISNYKQGFSIPLASWLRFELKDWASDLLSYESLSQFNIFDHIQINKVWNDHLNEKNNYEYDIWSLLMFIEWARYNRIRV